MPMPCSFSISYLFLLYTFLNALTSVLNFDIKGWASPFSTFLVQSSTHTTKYLCLPAETARHRRRQQAPVEANKSSNRKTRQSMVKFLAKIIHEINEHVKESHPNP
jgi:hypothetical protein